MTEFIGFDAPQGRPGGSGLTVLVLDRFAIAALSLPGGEIWNWGHGLGKDIRQLAREKLVTGGHVGPDARLLRSTDYSVVPSGVGLIQINVRATARHALWFILGTAPHEEKVERRITYQSGPYAGKEDFGFMKFFWIKGGFTRYEQRVWHPGWQGFNYLDEAKLQTLIERGII